MLGKRKSGAYPRAARLWSRRGADVPRSVSVPPLGREGRGSRTIAFAFSPPPIAPLHWRRCSRPDRSAAPHARRCCRRSVWVWLRRQHGPALSTRLVVGKPKPRRISLCHDRASCTVSASETGTERSRITWICGAQSFRARRPASIVASSSSPPRRPLISRMWLGANVRGGLAVDEGRLAVVARCRCHGRLRVQCDAELSQFAR